MQKIECLYKKTLLMPQSTMVRPCVLPVAAAVRYSLLLFCVSLAAGSRLIHMQRSMERLQSNQATKETHANVNLKLPQGNYSNRAPTCKPPFILDKARDICVCESGKYLTTVGSCLDCMSGFYCPQPAAGTKSVMKRCPENTVTRGTGAKLLSECINAPGYCMATPKERGSNGARVIPCGPNEFSTGLDGATHCTPCSAGFVTDPKNEVGSHNSSAVCVAPPGYFVLGNGVAACPVGTFSPDYSSYTTCVDCEDVFGPGVTTADVAATSTDACIAQPGKVFVDIKGRTVIDGFQNISSTTVQAVKDCPQGYYCPGGSANGTGVAVLCPRGMSTEEEGAASEDACVAPPGWVLPADGSTIQECITGTYRAGWDRSTSCTPCGEGPWLSDRTEALDVLDPNTGQPLMLQYVRGSPWSCYIQPGMGTITVRSSSSSGSSTLLAIVCPEGFYGSSVRRYGLLVGPCAACPTAMVTAGMDRATSYVDIDGQDVAIPSGGYYSVQSCVTPAGFGYEGDQAQECPQGYYNTGYNHLPCTQCPHGTTTPAPRSASISDCSVYLPGWGLSTASGLAEKCPIGTYSDGTGRVHRSPCSPCPEGRSTSDTGAESVEQCDVCREGYGGASAAACEPCPGGCYNPRYGRMLDSTRCLQCPVDRTWTYDWTGADDVYVPTATGRPGGVSTADCLADFSQTVDGPFYLDLIPGPDYMAVQVPKDQVITLQSCVEYCRNAEACAAVTFDYSNDRCSLWQPGSARPGMTYATDGGLAFKTFTSAKVVSSVRDGTNTTVPEGLQDRAQVGTATTAKSAAGTIVNTAGKVQIQSKAYVGDTQPGLFSYSVGSAAAGLSLSQQSLANVADVASLTECLRSCVFDNLCSGVVFGAYDADSNVISSIVGAPSGITCQKIQGTIRPGNSQRTLLKARNIASLPMSP